MSANGLLKMRELAEGEVTFGNYDVIEDLGTT